VLQIVATSLRYMEILRKVMEASNSFSIANFSTYRFSLNLVKRLQEIFFSLTLLKTSIYIKQNPWPLVRKRIIPTDDSHFPTKFSANFCR
jgi:hypothetical protein